MRLIDPAELAKIRKDLPIYIFAGDKDPLNHDLEFVKPLAERYRAAGIANVSEKYYPDGRHEMLNETNRDEVMRDLLSWIQHWLGAGLAAMETLLADHPESARFCHGDRVSPPLDWSGAPEDTKSLALVVDDSSAPITPYIYWLVFDIQPGTTDIQEGALPTGARQALNSMGTRKYDAPCPSGHSHSYRFTVYALNRQLTLPDGAPLLAVWTAIGNATIGRGRIVVTGNP